MKKFSDIFYRGMGEPFVKDVLREGLLKGHSITTSPEVALEYAGKGAQNILEGDIHKGKLPPRSQGYVNTLKSLGIDSRDARRLVPINMPPRGAVLQINIPSEKIPQHLKGVTKALAHLYERVIAKPIPPSQISVLQQGFLPGNPAGFPAGMRRLTNKQMRLLKSISRQGKGEAAVELIFGKPQSYALSTPQRISETRVNRRMFTKMLQKLITKGK